MKRYLALTLLILLFGVGAFFYVKDDDAEDNNLCFLVTTVNVSDVNPPIVTGPGFPPRVGFKGITLNEVVARSPRRVLVGFFNFRPSNWTGERPRCYLKALEGFSENWTGFLLPDVSLSNVTLQDRVYLAFGGWVFRKENDHLLVLKLRDEGNLYLLLARGEEADVKKLADSISSM